MNLAPAMRNQMCAGKLHELSTGVGVRWIGFSTLKSLVMVNQVIYIFFNNDGARCSSVVRAFAHGAIDRSFMGWTH